MWGPDSESPCYLLPGEFGRRMASQYGANRKFAPVECWTVDPLTETTSRVVVVAVHSADGYSSSADYVELASGHRLSAFYIWPVAKHHKPELAQVTDAYGKCTQWVCRLHKRCLSHY